MKPFRKIAIAALAASVAGTALATSLPAYSQGGAASGNGGQQIGEPHGQRFAHMGERGWRGRGDGFGPHRSGFRGERLFERFDANDDGVITGEEIIEVRAQSFSDADTDGSGDISLDEFRAGFLDRTKDMRVRAFQFMDADGDGNVTRAEADKLANRMFNRLDRDGNGTVERVRTPRAPGAGRDDDRPRGERAGRGEGPDREMRPGEGPERAGPGPRAEDRPGERGGHMGRHGMHRGHDGPGRWGGRGSHGGPGGMFLALFDTDSDGKVTREDFDARRTELFAIADTDGSGSFTLEDFAPLWLTINQDRVVDMFQRLDKDGSLGVSADEHGARMDRMMERADRNGDGVITEADFKGPKGGKPGRDGKGGPGWHKRG